eukprot:Pgem_evm1s4522
MEFHYLGVMDGYYKASESMIQYIKELFGGGWDDDFNGGDEDDSTTILQKRNQLGGVDLVEIKPG